MQKKKLRGPIEQKSAADLTVDLTFGFPGQIPNAPTSGDRQRLLRFFHNVAKGMDKRAAARAAGYGAHWAKFQSYGYCTKHKDFIEWLQAHYAQAAAKHLEIDQQQVLEEMVKIAFANEADYIVVEEVKVDGKLQPRARRKRVDELTREQLTAVVVYNRPGAARVQGYQPIDWKWRDRDGMLQLVAKHLGMLNEKIIMEHRHRHLQMTFDLSKVPMGELEAMESQFNQLMGQWEVGDAEGPVPDVRDSQEQVPRGRNGNGGSQDAGG